MVEMEALAETEFAEKVLTIQDALEAVELIDDTQCAPGCVVLTLKPVDSRQAAERVAWALMKSTAAAGMRLTVDAAAFTEALFTRSFCEDWRRHAMVWSPLKQADLFCLSTLTARAKALVRDAARWSHDGRALLEFATTRDRSAILDTDMKLFLCYEDYQAFFNYVGEQQNCAYCLSNHVCMVAGCNRRPSDAFCPNFRVKGKTFRYEFRHQTDGIGGTIHACGKCAKSMLFFKKELVTNWGRAKTHWVNGRRHKPRESAFHQCTLKDGRCYHIDEVREEGATPEWWLFLLQHETAHPEGDLLVKEVGLFKNNGLDKARRAEKERVVAEEADARRFAAQESRTTRMEWEARQALARAREKVPLAPRPAVVVPKPVPKPVPVAAPAAPHRPQWQSSYISALTRP